MTVQFQITLTRYKDGERRQSAPQFIQAEDFRQAMQFAEAMLTGCRMDDNAGEFGIAQISMSGLGGPTCKSGWQTSEETEEAPY
jgi:hypothetical protein|tara:strand:+ start:779 stop:1030 length:252 start_codon:yes stop_codon:yes gene_type:complete